jgi:hypothetical protein
MTLPNLYALSEHVTSIADEYGLVAAVRIFEGTASDIATAGTRIECTVSNMRREPPLESSKNMRLEYFNQVGVTAFDEFIREEAAPRLSAQQRR